jgi:hypothetical protein
VPCSGQFLFLSVSNLLTDGRLGYEPVQPGRRLGQANTGGLC